MNSDSGNKRKKKKHTIKYYIIDTIRRLIMFAALCTFSYTSFKLTNIYLEYQEGDEAYDNMEEMFEIPNIGSGEQATDMYGNTIVNSRDQAVWKYDFDALKNMNSDAVGWIKQDNIISYPIVNGTDNTYYLTHNAAHVENKSGAIFVDYRVEGGIEAKNCIIYGHNMNNGSMFGSLMKYRSESYYKEHPTFDIYIGPVGYRYYVFATYTTDAIGDTYTYNFLSDEDYQEYINLSMSKRSYETAIKEVKTTDRIITLSTCTNTDSGKRYIVQMIRGEQITE